MSLEPREYLKHILDETAYIISNSRQLTKADFMKDETLKRAYVRSIEVMGEAVKQLPNELRDKYTTVDWRLIAGMRDRLAHAYFGIDYDIVWNVIIDKIPALDKAVRQILEKEDR